MRLLVILAVLFTFGCAAKLNGADKSLGCAKNCNSSVVSRKVASGLYEGVLYSVPRQLVQLKIVREKQTEKKLEDAVKAAKDRVGAFKVAVSTAKQKVIDLESMVGGASPDGAKPKLELELEVARLKLLVLKKKQAKSEEFLQSKEAELSTFQRDPKEFSDTVTLSATKPVVDEANRFVAQVNRSAFSSETVEVKTTAQGLLSGGTATSDGQADEIFVALAETIAALGFVGGPPPGVVRTLSSDGEARADDRCKKKELTFLFDIDFYDAEWDEKLEKKLAEKNLCYRFELKSDQPSSTPLADGTLINGLVYPTTRVIRFDIFNTEPSSEAFVESLYATIADARLLGYVSLPKAIFSTNNFEFEFNDGMLTRYKSVTPNELVQALGMVPKAAKAIVSIPTELVQLKVDYSNKQAAYYEAKEAAYTARLQYELLRAQGDDAIIEEESGSDTN